MLFKDVDTPSSEQPVAGEDRQEIFMNIIEKQGAVTRLATAIQNRMLKVSWMGNCSIKPLGSSELD